MAFNKEASNNIFNQAHELWIAPEIQRRKTENRLPGDFKILQCLIKLPKNQPAIVEFNNEIHWQAEIQHIKKSTEASFGDKFAPGQPVYMHEIQEITEVQPPMVDGVRVAFMYIFYTGIEYKIIFDFTPNSPGLQPDDKLPWTLGGNIASHLQLMFREMAIRIHDNAQIELRKIGLWAAPSLLPYPLTLIIKQLMKDQKPEIARQTLVQHCNSSFIENLLAKWWNIPQISPRKALIQDAFEVHAQGKYRLSIHALLPQIEGIITEWVIAKLPDENSMPFRLESKTKKFRDLLTIETAGTFIFQRVLNSTIEFILEGPVLASFKRWVEAIDASFPNRHIVEHGRYDETIFTEENSIKLFLLIDTIADVIAFPKKSAIS